MKNKDEYEKLADILNRYFPLKNRMYSNIRSEISDLLDEVRRESLESGARHAMSFFKPKAERINNRYVRIKGEIYAREVQEDETGEVEYERIDPDTVDINGINYVKLGAETE